jgi:enoyl-CoA hydratase/carnithine racemase
VAFVSWNAPKALNAFRMNTHWETFATLKFLKVHTGVRTVVWTGAGPKAFSCGADFGDVFTGKTTIPEPYKQVLVDEVGSDCWNFSTLLVTFICVLFCVAP